MSLENLKGKYTKNISVGLITVVVQENIRCLPIIHSKTSFEKNCFYAWASTLNMGLINKRLIWYIPQATNIPYQPLSIKPIPISHFVCSKREVQFAQNEFHLCHFGKDWSRARPVMSDVSNCVRVASVLVKVYILGNHVYQRRI